MMQEQAAMGLATEAALVQQRLKEEDYEREMQLLRIEEQRKLR